MKTYLLLALTIPLLASCSSTYSVRDQPASDQFSFAQVNEAAKNRSFIISAIGYREIRGTDLNVANDSTTFLESNTGKRGSIQTSSLLTIRLNNVGKGALDGLLPGAVVGLSAGLFFASVLNQAFGGSGELSSVPIRGLLVLGGGGAAGGALLGALTGAIIGHTDKYVFQTQDNSHAGSQ